MTEYWFCTIGPIERESLPQGADFPLRQAVKQSYETLTGSIDYYCASGWGVTEEMAEAMFYARENPKEVIKLLRGK